MSQEIIVTMNDCVMPSCCLDFSLNFFLHLTLPVFANLYLQIERLAFGVFFVLFITGISIISIIGFKGDPIILTYLEERSNAYALACTQKVGELFIGFCPVVFRVLTAARVEELSSLFTQ